MQEFRVVRRKSLKKVSKQKNVTLVITLTLLHPLQSVTVQTWPFESKSVIRIGRSTDNDVILYSAVVSRYHVELRHKSGGWEIISLGANGTYIDGKRITEMPVVDGMIIRLASSGPKIKIEIDDATSNARRKAALGKRSVSQKNGGDQELKETLVDAEGKQK